MERGLWFSEELIIIYIGKCRDIDIGMKVFRWLGEMFSRIWIRMGKEVGLLLKRKRDGWRNSLSTLGFEEIEF